MCKTHMRKLLYTPEDMKVHLMKRHVFFGLTHYLKNVDSP